MYVPGRKAANKLGIHQNTLRRWADAGKIPHIRTAAGQRLYDIETFIAGKTQKKDVCYCRVSSYKQRDDLARQVDYMRQRYPSHEIVTDIGSGLNSKRKGFRSILELADQGVLGEIVVAHRDRLCRFAFDLVEWWINAHGGKIVVLGEVQLSPEAELTQDLLAIIHVFSCRLHGLRKYARQIKEDQALSKRQTKRNAEAVDGDGEICV